MNLASDSRASSGSAPRLFLAMAYPPEGPEESWGRGIQDPPGFRREADSDKRPAIVFSPSNPGQTAAPLRVYRDAEGQIRLRIVDSGASLNSYLPNDAGVVWLPVLEGGPFKSCRRGFVLEDVNEETLAVFAPNIDKEGGSGWPDWSTALNARGIALLKFDGMNLDLLAEEAKRDGWPIVQLDDERGPPEHDSEQGWLNPLVVGFRHGETIPGLEDEAESGIARSIRHAVRHHEHHLVPMLGDDTARRFFGWKAVAGARRSGSHDSILTSLFFPSRRHAWARPDASRLANLAALDGFGGHFEAVCDPPGRLNRWEWHMPSQLNEGCRQVARQIGARTRGLQVVESNAESRKVFHWRWDSVPGGQRTIVPLPPVRGRIGRVLESMGNSRAQDAVSSTLGQIAKVLAEEADQLGPKAADALFAPLLEGTLVSDSAAGRWYTQATFTALVEQFFEPASPVLVRLVDLKPVDADEAERMAFEKEWGRQWIDLFQSAGVGAADTLRATVGLFGDDDSESDEDSASTVKRSGWSSAFWRHCVAGSAATSFRLRWPSPEFRVDESYLDGAALLG